MKHIFETLTILIASVLLAGCIGDNYSQPNAGIYGVAIDIQTGEPILQDIGSDGSQLEMYQLGYETPQKRYLNFKTDGSFCDKNFFNGKYSIQGVRTNFQQFGPEEIELNGLTEYKINTLPYCRVTVESIEFQEEKQRVVAKFSVECTTSDYLKEVGLFCDETPVVSYSINNQGDKSCKIDVDRRLTTPETFTIKMGLATLEDGEDYYFRVGAHTSVDQAMWNYAEAVKLHIVKKDIPKKEVGIRWDLFDRFEIWDKHKTLDVLAWDDKDFKSGNGSVLCTSKDQGGPGYTQFMTPGESAGGIRPRFDASSIPFEGCHMLLTLFVSDATHFEKSANGQIEISSAGIYDSEEISWTFAQFDLRNGWQTLDLSVPEGNPMGDIRMGKLDWFRFYHLMETGPTTVKFDEIRFYYKTLVDDCDDLAGWKANGSAYLDESDVKQGEGCVVATNGGDLFTLEKKYSKPYYAPAKQADGYLQFWMYVNDPAVINNASGGQIEITSGGNCDVEELAWALPKVNQGWNKIVLKLADGTARGGNINLTRVNYFRIWATIPGCAPGALQVKVDGIRFYKEGHAPQDEEE